MQTLNAIERAAKIASTEHALLTLVPPPLEFPGIWLADETKCQVRVATYAEPDQPAVHAVWMVGKAHSLDPHGQAYPVPFPCDSWQEFEFYSTSDEQYHPVNGPIDMTDRGAFILFWRLHGGHCPDIAHWEEHAVRLADKEAGKPNYTPSKAATRRPSTRASTVDVSDSARSTPSKATHGSPSRTSGSAASASPSADESPQENVDEPSNNLLVKDVETWLAATTRDKVTSSKRKLCVHLPVDLRQGLFNFLWTPALLGGAWTFKRIFFCLATEFERSTEALD
ncbi:hypothetical protein C8F04DRAFT_1181925 [Mycena alexandri]|uniref:Uncharacterized protein n=1 Tax=Mycena alexandri TaxID=1745969 RepID=A0AAD6SXK3_9AGAR|nr:hypothetical protein C8F04DRAFT_1181925 [Mycena alexandri]